MCLVSDVSGSLAMTSPYYRISLPKLSELIFKKKKGNLRWLEKEAFLSRCVSALCNFLFGWRFVTAA